MNLFKRAVDWFIIVSLASDVLYSPYMVFFVMRPPSGRIGPLMEDAANVPYDLIVTRRLYTIEMWAAFIGLILYLKFRHELWGFVRRKPQASDLAA